MIWLIIYLVGLVVNFVLLWDYLTKELMKEMSTYGWLVYLGSVLLSWLIWILIIIRWAIRKARYG